MRVVFDIDFGNTNSQMHFGIYDSDINTLEYISRTKLEEKVRKGYVVQDLAMKDVPGLKPQIDVINTVVHSIPQLQKQTEVGSYNKKSWLVLNQPIYFKNLKSGLYFIYNQVTFAYQKRRGGNEWTVMIPSGMKLENGFNVLFQLVPYLLCGDVFILHFDTSFVSVLDLSVLAPLSKTKRLQIFSDNRDIVTHNTAIKVGGLLQNIDITNLMNRKQTYVNLEGKNGLRVIDLTELYVDNKTPTNIEPYIQFAENIQAYTLLLCPNIPNYAKECKSTNILGRFGDKDIEWIDVGNYSKKSDYIGLAKKQIAKYSLMGKKIEDYIFYATIG